MNIKELENELLSVRASRRPDVRKVALFNCYYCGGPVKDEDLSFHGPRTSYVLASICRPCQAKVFDSVLGEKRHEHGFYMKEEYTWKRSSYSKAR